MILSIFGISLAGRPWLTDALPYRQRDDFLSPAEVSLYQVLVSALGARATICPKVNLADIVFVARPHENQAYRNKIDRKHVDFLICDSKTMRPQCAIELDDSSHSRPARQQRDSFVDEVFKAAGLPLLRVRAQAAYRSAGLLLLVEPHLKGSSAAEQTRHVTAAPSTGLPTCPKCGVPMVKRVAKKGPSSGQAFYGCPNYPRCREVAQLVE
jgi:hypothetical protein